MHVLGYNYVHKLSFQRASSLLLSSFSWQCVKVLEAAYTTVLELHKAFTLEIKFNDLLCCFECNLQEKTYPAERLNTTLFASQNFTRSNETLAKH